VRRRIFRMAWRLEDYFEKNTSVGHSASKLKFGSLLCFFFVFNLDVKLDLGVRGGLALNYHE
jgi:hypothetical protein